MGKCCACVTDGGHDKNGIRINNKNDKYTPEKKEPEQLQLSSRKKSQKRKLLKITFQNYLEPDDAMTERKDDNPNQPSSMQEL